MYSSPLDRVGFADQNGGRPHSARVRQDTQLVSGAVGYLERKGIRHVLLHITKSLLADEPEDPATYIVDQLKHGWPGGLESHQPSTSATAAAAAAAKAPAKGRCPSSCEAPGTKDAIEVACAFLEEEPPGTREAVHQLLASVARATGGAVDFLSPPGGRGRGAKLRGQSQAERAGFLLVASSDPHARAGEVTADAARVVVLRSALDQGTAASEDVVAAAVRTPRGLEGVLLVRGGGGGKEAAVGGGLAATKAVYGELALLPAMRLWSLVLAERLESLRLRMEAESAKAAIGGALDILENLTLNKECSREMPAAIAGMVPSGLIRGGIGLEEVNVWMHDSLAHEMVLNNNGQMDGTRVSVKESLVGDVVRCGGIGIIAAEGVVAESCSFRAADPRRGGPEGAQNTICVPFGLGCELAVVQFASAAAPPKRPPSGGGGGGASRGTMRPARISHFDLVAAESLQTSVLPSMLKMRQYMLELFQAERQRSFRKLLADLLGDASCVTDVARIVQKDLPGLLGCECCSMFFIDEELDELWSPPTDVLPEGIRVDIGRGVVGHVAKRALEEEDILTEVVVANDMKSCPEWLGDVGDGFVTRNMMTVPVWSGRKNSRLIGLVQTLNKCAPPGSEAQGVGTASAGGAKQHVNFTPSDVALLDLLAREMELVMQRLLLDMVWTKARMDAVGADGGDAPLITSEYYRCEGCGSPNVISCVEEVIVIATRKAQHAERQAAEVCLDEERLVKKVDSQRVNVGGWEIDYWALTDIESFALLKQALTLSGVYSELSVATPTLYNFFLGVKATYQQENPYHNFHHAMSTVHYTSLLLHGSGIINHLSKTDTFALLVAAVCHDCGHRGYNSMFEMVTRSELALRYNDNSPLENHHCAVAFEVALKDGEGSPRNIFKNLSPEAYSHARKQMISAILATDMKHHGSMVNLLMGFELQSDAGEHAQFFVELLLHLADISNPIMPPKISRRWGQAIASEFTAQARAEERLGLPVTPFMVGLTDPIAAAKSQLGFIDFVFAPLANPFFRHFPGLREPREYMEHNREESALIVGGGTEPAEGRASSAGAQNKRNRKTSVLKQPRGTSKCREV